MSLRVGKRRIELQSSNDPKKRSKDLATLIRMREAIDAILATIELKTCYVCGADCEKQAKRYRNQVREGYKSKKNLIKELGPELGLRTFTANKEQQAQKLKALVPQAVPIVQIPGKTIYARTCSLECFNRVRFELKEIEEWKQLLSQGRLQMQAIQDYLRHRSPSVFKSLPKELQPAATLPN